jgi:hypothetical protein
MSDDKKPKPKFPVLIELGRVGQSPQWETSDAEHVSQRIAQLEADSSVVWFKAYRLTAYKIEAIKKTIVVTETPTGEDAEGEV